MQMNVGKALIALVILAALLAVGFTWVFPADDGGAPIAPEPTAEAEAPPPGPSASAMPSASASVPAPPPPPPPLENLDAQPDNREDQHKAIFRALQAHYDLDEAAMKTIQGIFSAKRIGQGNPKATKHPMTKRECLDIRAKADLAPSYSARCDARYMVPAPNKGQSADEANVCIDQFEFPGIPCEYPVTWVSAREAALLCQAVGKRMCDAHEWEGACAGEILPVEDEYHFGKARKYAKSLHNKNREKVWAYGPDKDHKKCATGSQKSEKCGDGGKCGSNTYPTGAFPECVSKLGVYDLHGNAAEHMNLPMAPDQLMSKGGSGETEMKGSWFIFQSYEAHEDDCRWRAPDWHVSKVMVVDSHANYHLGFRCCKDVAAAD